MRLIDANEVIKNIVYERDKIPYELVSEKPYHAGDQMRGGIRKALRCIEQAPTVDAVPVRHGRWETNSDRPDTLICSICKCGFDMWKHDPHNYCPNCGAKMDGGAD